MGGAFLQNLEPTDPSEQSESINTPAVRTPVVGNIRFIASNPQLAKLRAISGVKIDPETGRE